MLEIKRKEFDNTIYPRFYYQLLTMPLVYKARSVRELPYKNLLIWRYSSQKAFGFIFFSGEVIFVALKLIERRVQVVRF